jgi:hypothetical protein
MAQRDESTGWRFSVGAVVYSPYSPAQTGVITQVEQPPTVVRRDWRERETTYTPMPVYRVRWTNTKRGTTDETTLGDYEALTEEHERKALKHRATLDKIRRDKPVLDQIEREEKMS